MFFKNNKLDTSLFSKELKKILMRTGRLAGDSRSSIIRPGHFLMAILEICDEDSLIPVTENLDGCTLADIIEGIKNFLWEDPSKPIPPIDFSPENFSENSLCIFKDLEKFSKGSMVEDLVSVTIEKLTINHILYCLLKNLDDEEQDILSSGFDVNAAIQLTEVILKRIAHPIQIPPIFDINDSLQSELFDTVCIKTIKASVLKASQMGYKDVRPPHLLLCLIDQSEGTTLEAIRLQSGPDSSPKKVISTLEQEISMGPNPRKNDLDLKKNCFSNSVKTILENSLLNARQDGQEQVDENYLFKAVLSHGDTKIRKILTRYPLYLDLSKMISYVKERIKRKLSEGASVYHSVNWPEHICPSVDLTQQALNEEIGPIISRETELEKIKQALFKKENHNVLLYGENGVGITAMVHGLALEIGQGKVEFLRNRPVVSLDISAISESDLKTKVQHIFTTAESQPWGIYFIEGIDRLIRTDKELIKNILRSDKLMVIGSMSIDAYTDLVAYDEELRNRLVGIEVKEPDKEIAIQILKTIKSDIEQEYGAHIDDKALEKSVKLSHSFIMNERLPAKAIRVLKAACDTSRYEIQQSKKFTTVNEEQVIKEISRITGLPDTMIKGTGKEEDYHARLSEMVKGQDEAVCLVADRLDLIQKGIVDRKRPAGIFLFVGLTGVGKTELAKAIASLYSSSKKLIVYPMGEGFDTPESVSKLFGSPPGYIGYEQGGKLINDLNADPYSVILLDEVEKAHPAIWDSFLNLFDEGWARDGRGVEARSNKAFFVLTSNICADLICDCLEQKIDIYEIIKEVNEEIGKAIHKKSGQRCFKPEFLGRIQEVVIFKPLDESAIKDITRLKLQALKDEWKEDRDIELDVKPIIDKIAELSFKDTEGGKKEGGRAVAKRIDSMVKSALAKYIKNIIGAKRVELLIYQEGEKEEIQPIPITESSLSEEKSESHDDTIDFLEDIQRSANKVLEFTSEDIDRMNQEEKEKLTQGIQLIEEVLERRNDGR